MRPAYAGRKVKCVKCSKEIGIGERMIRETIKDKWGYIKSLPMHVECALEGRKEWLEMWFNNNEPRQRALRRKCANPVKRRSLLSLLNYHRKRGNLLRVRELEEEIKKMEETQEINETIKRKVTREELLRIHGIIS